MRVKLVIDEFDKLKTEECLRKVLKLANFDVEQRPRAEKGTAVATVSMLTRATREFWIDDASKRLHLDLRKLLASEALTYRDAGYFAKISFLHHRWILISENMPLIVYFVGFCYNKKAQKRRQLKQP